MSSRINTRLQVAILAAWHSLRSLGSRRPPSDPKRILIAHHLLLGDTLMLTPLLAKLRERFPAAEIVMTVPKAITPLYESRPYGVIAIPYDPRDPATLRALRDQDGFDLAIVPGDNRHSWLARALGAKWIIAHADDTPPYKNWPVDERIPYPNSPGAWGDIIAGLIPGAPPHPYQLTSWQAPHCAPFDLPPSPYCVLHVGASSPLKRWEDEKWQTLAAGLQQQGYNIAWSGGPGEQQLIAEIDQGGKYLSYAGQLDLPQLWHLIGNARLLVSPDTGVAHLGRIIGTPTVTLFGPGSAVICGAGHFWRDAPYRAVTVANFSCRNQNILFRRHLDWAKRCGRTPVECATPACMHAISITAVEGAVRDLLNSETKQ